MKKSSRPMTKKRQEQNARRSLSAVHILIAVVAIIECLILVGFTTYSWIESNSSLVIQNGPNSVQDPDTIRKMDIAGELSYKINLNTTDGMGFKELKNFFSKVKYFEFAKTTTADGKTFFFPRLNNTHTDAQNYRKGDTVDYNTSYLYFDFVLSNWDDEATGYHAENCNVYFSPGEYADIFTVSQGDFPAYDSTDLEAKDYVTALKNAMRISITTQVGSAPENTRIYAMKEYSNEETKDAVPYSSIPANTENATNANITAEVTTGRFSDYVYAYDEETNKVTSKELFAAKRNADTKVSVRIWFDWLDPDFQNAFGFSNSNTAEQNSDRFGTDEFKKIPSSSIGVKFAFETNANDMRSLYFDDYTFSNTAPGQHITDVGSGKSVWFYAYQPAIPATRDHPARAAGYQAIELYPDRTNSAYTRWWTSNVTASMMGYLMNTESSEYTSTDTQYTKSYFCYGDFETKQADYRWALPSKPLADGDFTFNAYSYQPSVTYTPAASAGGWSDCTGSSIKPGVGIWQDDSEYTIMALLKFRDMATVVTGQDYNAPGYSAGEISVPNYQHMNMAADADDHAHYLVYVNNVNAGTVAGNFGTTTYSQTVSLGAAGSTTISSTVRGMTAAMYYDEDEEVFMSYVPRYWLTGDGTTVSNEPAPAHKGVSFTYAPNGTFAPNAATIRWYNAAPAMLDGEYLYTALGYSNLYNNSASDLTGIGYVPGYYSGSEGYLLGVGTWKDVEQISLNTDLIDSDLSAAYRYYVGIPDTVSKGYYVMIPDESHMTFSAYVPKNVDASAASIKFIRKATLGDGAVNAYWAPNQRGSYSYSTYYPVEIDDGIDADDRTRGYWNLSVLVDGSYENLIYTTLTDGTGSTVNAPTAVDTSDTEADPPVYSFRLIFDDTIHNYGKLEYNDGSGWTTITDDTNTTDTNRIDRYRFYAPAEGKSTITWRWTPYKGYNFNVEVGDGAETMVAYAPDTQFTFVHNVSNVAESGIYKVVTEAPSTVTYDPPEATEEPTEEPSP